MTIEVALYVQRRYIEVMDNDLTMAREVAAKTLEALGWINAREFAATCELDELLDAVETACVGMRARMDMGR